jgi:E3 ubiquitin-protein ligase MYCBP2
MIYSVTYSHLKLNILGNEVIFSLETASDYVLDEKANTYGFRCLVVGYEWPSISGDGLRHLECELAFLGGMCAASLMKKDLQLPPASGIYLNLFFKLCFQLGD